MKEYHVMFTRNKVFYSMMLWFTDFNAVEDWLELINANYWEIGI